MIADLARLLGSDKETLRFSAAVAKAVVTENFSHLADLPTPQTHDWSGAFQNYIPRAWIKKQRIICGSVCIGSTKILGYVGYRNMFKNNLGQSSKADKILYKADDLTIVRADQLLLTYQNPGENSEEIQIKAPCGGKLILLERKDNNVHAIEEKTFLDVLVVSYFDDYEDVKKWHTSKYRGA